MPAKLLRDLPISPPQPRRCAQAGPLLIFSQEVSFLGRGKAALRRQAELIEADVFGGGLDAAFKLILGFQIPALRGHQAQHHGLVLGTSRSGSNEPARSVSYSMKYASMLTSLNRISATGS